MTNREAIERIKDHMRVHKIGEYPHIHIAEALNLAIAVLESPRPDWTPCAEGLPGKVDKRLWSRDVLATIKQKTGNCFVVVAYYHYGCEQWKTDDMTDNDAIDVLAWQPLPVPYRADQKEDNADDHK